MASYCKLTRMEGFSFTPGQVVQVTPAMQEMFDRDGYIIIRYVINRMLKGFKIQLFNLKVPPVFP